MTATAGPETAAPPPGGPSGPSSQGGPSGQGAEPPSAGQVARRRWRTSRGILLTILALVVVAVVLASLRPTVQPQYLDSESASKGGARALAQILGKRGTPVETARSASDAVDRARPGAVLVVTRSERLTSSDIDRLRAAQGDLLLIEPTQEVLDSLAPGVREATGAFDETADPECTLNGATLAGEVEFKQSQTYEAPGSATRCYPAEGLPRLVQLPAGARTVTVLGSGRPLTNDRLDEAGNAALGLNLAGAGSSVVWLIPDPPERGAGAEEKSFMDLVPFGVKLALLQLLIAVALVALWRSRRLGPVVAEPLPVVVRSAETVEGRSRLYRAHHARGRAAEELRSGIRERLVPLLGLPRSSAEDPAAAREIVTAIAQRSEWDETTIGSALYGPEPVDDHQLIRLSDFLDDLERQVRTS